MPDASEDVAVTWLMLIYRLPARPPALRAVIRRKLTAASAVYLSPAVTVVPSSGPAERILRQVQHVVTGAGGSAILLRGQAAGGEPQMIAEFNAARDREYEDIIADCRDAVRAIGALAAASDCGYEQLWDHDAGLKQLSARYSAARERDMFGAGRAQAAASALAGYQAALDGYAKHVYATDNGS